MLDIESGFEWEFEARVLPSHPGLSCRKDIADRRSDLAVPGCASGVPTWLELSALENGGRVEGEAWGSDSLVGSEQSCSCEGHGGACMVTGLT